EKIGLASGEERIAGLGDEEPARFLGIRSTKNGSEQTCPVTAKRTLLHDPFSKKPTLPKPFRPSIVFSCQMP
ncbi:MAG: hypothetical protein ACOYPR_09865, partial [Saprospiraceae bacterium]